MSPTMESAQVIARRMDQQRAQLRTQLLRPKPPTEQAPPTASTAMQAYEPRSLLMRVLMGNPQLIQRAAMLLATTLLGARYSSWGLKLFGLFLAARKR